MPTVVTVSELFKTANLSPCGPVPWCTPVPEYTCAVYLVALVRKPRLGCAQQNVEYLPPSEHERWLPKQPVLYVGCTRRPLKDRIAEFYRHKYGKTSPHSGGQAIKLLRHEVCLWVYWSATNDPRAAERMMISAFEERVGALPFANRRD